MPTRRTASTKPKKFERRPDPDSADPMVGLRFLLLNKDGDPTWQGQFIAAVAPGLYLVELFGWLMGDPTEMRVMPLSDFVTTAAGDGAGAVLIDDCYDVSLTWGPYQERAKTRREQTAKQASAKGTTDDRSTPPATPE